MLTRALILIVMVLGSLWNTFSTEFFSVQETSSIEFQINNTETFDVSFFPVAPYYVGDILSVKVTYNGAQDIGGKQVHLSTPNNPEQLLGTETFSSYTHEAIFYWTVDTTGFEPGFYSFLFTVPDFDQTWTAGVNLLPAKPGEKPEWQSVTTDCCIINYLSNSDAAEDIDEIQQTLETEVNSALLQFFPDGIPNENPLEEPLEIALIPAVVGHGGFATNIAVLTYTHRNWTGIEFDILAHHEIVHVIDRRSNPGPRPTLFSEGLAVYLSGGHYHKGDLLARGAALLESGLYRPLSEVADQLYEIQHEIAYMEAGAFMAYLDQTWGWETLIDFYFNLPDGQSDSEIISSALESRFEMTLDQLESEFTSYLETIDLDQDVIDDVNLTISAYDTVRRYQALAIPSAHYQTAWWPSINQMIETGIIGDYAEREKSPFNIVIEGLLINAHMSLENRDYKNLEETLERINQYLSMAESQNPPPSLYALGRTLPILAPEPASSIKLLP